jgi:hypothetical protein
VRGPGTRLCCRTAAPEGRRARHVRAQDRTDLPCPEHTRAVGRVRLGCGWWARFGGWVRHAVTPNPSQVGSVPCGRGCRPRAREDHAPGGLWLPRRRRTGPPQCRRRQPCDRERAVRGGRARARRVRAARGRVTRSDARGPWPPPRSSTGPPWGVVGAEPRRGRQGGRARACGGVQLRCTPCMLCAPWRGSKSQGGARFFIFFLSADPRKKNP